MKKSEKTLERAIAERRASPSFDGTPIPPEDLRRILDAGLHAPSGYNIQPWRFEADDNAQWRLVPDSADPLVMLRQ